MTTTEFRIYVASLMDYNNGILHGRWIDVTDVETIWEEINKMLEESPSAKEYHEKAEEWAVHDYEGFGDVLLGENPDFEKLVEIVEGVEEFGEAFLAFIEHTPEGDKGSFQ